MHLQCAFVGIAAGIALIVLGRLIFDKRPN